MIRTLTLIGGLAGAAGLSQFPEFSQQYLQRLSGAVDELRVVVTGFDLAAQASGKTRDEALAAMDDTGFEGDLRQTMTRSINRYERLEGDLAALKAANPLERLAQPWNMADAKLFQATLDDYQPAIPVTRDGAITTGIGFAGGWIAVGLIVGLIRRPFRRRAA